MDSNSTKAPFDFGLDIFSSVPPSSSTPDTTMASLSSTMLGSPGVVLGGGVVRNREVSDTISLDSFDDDSGMRPGDWQYVPFLSLSKPPHTPTSTPTPTPTQMPDKRMQKCSTRWMLRKSQALQALWCEKSES